MPSTYYPFKSAYYAATLAVGVAISLSSGTPANVVSVTVPAGEWNIRGNANYDLTSASGTQLTSDISNVSGSIVSDGTECYGFEPTGTNLATVAIPAARYVFTVATVVYLVAKATFGGGTVKAFGSITATQA